jgi:hypothetical protein
VQHLGVAGVHSSGNDFTAIKPENFFELGARAKVEAASNTMLSFSATPDGAPVAFAFKSGQVCYDRGRFTFDVTQFPFAPGVCF